MIECKPLKPTLDEYRHLFESTGWTSAITISDNMLKKALDKSWYWVSAFDQESLIGIGRLISDGALYAFVCDMIVLPEYQRKGIGKEILNMLKNRCLEAGIQRVWLFSASGRTEFYIKNGFDIRPHDAPGMQLKI
ncbi:MAG: GNAT family N-acetyltransferase [Deltaproteobacteria bacterium HGW-Deltaproteobacteria-15]|jgi:GNAT superfamily N-acetyltransferase|nr:MAG: GNAT family N-acetyltransferase [Deltaproteobacteria bacterium HGW-Deltaproteobacteria-15]